MEDDMNAIANLIHRTSTKRDLLRDVPLLADRPRRELDLISSLTDIVDVPAGKALIREGARGREFFIVLSGAADVSRDGLPVATLGAGEFFGEIAIVTKLPRTATVTAPVDSRVLVMTDRDLRRLVEVDAKIRLRVLSSMALRLQPLAG
jgi:CRP-like cAMP-binding protein